MTDRETMYKGISHAAWGYFFLNFDFNFNNVSIFPRFVGYILFYLAIEKLSGERRDLKLLRPLCVLMAAWTGGDWLLSWLGGDIDGHILFLDLMVAVAGLYLQFQFLTDMAALAETYRPSIDNDLDRRLRRRRSVYIVLVTAIALFTDPPGNIAIQAGWRTGIMMALAVIAMIASRMIRAGLFELRKFVLPDTVAETGPPE